MLCFHTERYYQSRSTDVADAAGDEQVETANPVTIHTVINSGKVKHNFKFTVGNHATVAYFIKKLIALTGKL